MAGMRARDAGQPEFLQAVEGAMASLWPFLAGHPRYRRDGLLERMVEPERVLQFRVAWVDDAGQTRVNRAWRVQHSCAIGPYKGGMRFHPRLDLSTLKFLAFEQTLKNALTGLPLGGAKGGADFDPRGRSRDEVMRFCQALMSGLWRHLGPDIDVPAGDIGVGEREIGYMAGMMKKLSHNTAGAFTGKGLSCGGIPGRAQATGHGLLYFVREMLAGTALDLAGARVCVSGSGNVALHAIEKAMQLGAVVQTASDSDGTVHDPNGFTEEKLAALKALKAGSGRVRDYARQFGLPFLAGTRPWHLPADIALPCATQNEVSLADARALIANGVKCVAEGANMPLHPEASAALRAAGVLYAPGKASNAGGVAVSAMEMAQNATLGAWTLAEVDRRLQDTMRAIHQRCVEHGERARGAVDYVAGANIAALTRLADAIEAQGVT